MPKAYYQCSVCGQRFSTKYKASEKAPAVECHHSLTKHSNEPKAKMAYLGDGYEGRRRKLQR